MKRRKDNVTTWRDVRPTTVVTICRHPPEISLDPDRRFHDPAPASAIPPSGGPHLPSFTVAVILKSNDQLHYANASQSVIFNRNIMQIVWLVIPGVRPGYRGAGHWPGVGVPQQHSASVAAVARP